MLVCITFTLIRPPNGARDCIASSVPGISPTSANFFSPRECGIILRILPEDPTGISASVVVSSFALSFFVKLSIVIFLVKGLVCYKVSLI